MADDPTQSEGGFSQEDIDALLNAASGAAEGDLSDQPAADDAAEPAQPGKAPDMAADAAAPGEPKDAPTEPAPATGGAVNQADVDALFAGEAAETGGKDPAEATEAATDQGEPAGEQPDEQRVDSMGRPFDEFAAAMQAAIDEEQPSGSGEDAATAAAPPPDTKPLDLQELDAAELMGFEPSKVSMLNDVNLHVKIELGRTRMLLEEVLNLGDGSVVELDKLAGDPVDVFVNERLVARGEVLILNDNFCVRISEVLEQDPHRITV